MIAKRRGERFKRIKCSTLARLLRESLAEESIYSLGRDGSGENGEVQPGDSVSQHGGLPVGALHQIPNHVARGASPNRLGPLRRNEETKDTQSVAMSVRTGASVRTAMSNCTAVTYATDMLGITADTQFLLLDLREPDEYQKWHIKESINFPAANIARDKTIPELFRFRNAPNKLIICYMLDERSGVQYAQLLNEKGYENTFLLSGGIEAFLEGDSDLVEGVEVPQPRRAMEEEEERK